MANTVELEKIAEHKTLKDAYGEAKPGQYVVINENGISTAKLAMRIIRPPHHKTAAKVTSWKEIEQDAREMEQLVKGNFKEGYYDAAYAVAHPQVSGEPRAFFVVNMDNKDVAMLFKHSVIVNPVFLKKEASSLIRHKEACMSRPFRNPAYKTRYTKTVVRYWYPWRIPLLGVTVLLRKTEKCLGLKACVFQHEAEHFKGVY